MQTYHLVCVLRVAGGAITGTSDEVTISLEGDKTGRNTIKRTLYNGRCYMHGTA